MDSLIGRPKLRKGGVGLTLQLARKGAPPQNLLPSATPLFLPFPSLHLQVSTWVVMSSSTFFQILCPLTHLWTTCAFHPPPTSLLTPTYKPGMTPIEEGRSLRQLLDGTQAWRLHHPCRLHLPCRLPSCQTEVHCLCSRCGPR